MIRRFARVFVGVAIGGAVAVGAVWTLIRTLGEPEPHYQNKPIGYWLERMNSTSADASNEVSMVLDTQIIPQLAKTLSSDTNDSPLRLALIDRLDRLAGVEISFLPAEGRRAGAATVLGQIGPPASRAIPTLIRASKLDRSGVVKGAAARAIGQICQPPPLAVPVLIACLDDPQDSVAEAAIRGLAKFGTLSKTAVPKLVVLARSSNENLKREARAALQKIDPEAAAKVAVAP